MATMLTMMADIPDGYTLEPKYRTFINSMAQYLRASTGVRIVDIPAEEGYLYRFDLTQFLLKNKVALEDHYVIQVVNGIESVHALDENLRTLVIPPQSAIASLKQIYRTSLTVS